MKHLLFGKFIYEHNSNPAKCWCDILQDGTKTIAVFTEMKDNKGVSVTNAVEEIARVFCEDRRLNPENVMFVERYETHPEDLDEILFADLGNFSGPYWKRLAKSESANILKKIHRLVV